MSTKEGLSLLSSGAAREPSQDGAAPSPPAARRWRSPSYRTTLVLSISALVVLTGLSVTLFAFSLARGAAEKLASAVFYEATGRATAETRQFVQRAPPVAGTLATIAGGGIDTLDQKQLGCHLAAILEANPGFAWVSFGDEQGRFTGAYRRPDGGPRLNLTHIVDGKTQMEELDLQPDGRLVPYREDTDYGYDPRNRPYYHSARQSGQGVWTPPYLFYNPRVPGVTYAEPVYDDESGDLLGVFTVDFDLRALSDLTRQLTFSEHSRLVIFTPQGEVVGHPTADLSPRSTQDDALVKIDEIADPVAAAFYAQLGAADFHVEDGNQRSRHFQFTVDGEPYFGTNTAVTLGPGLTWSVGAMAPQSDFLAVVQHGQRMSVVLSLVCVVGAVLLGAILAGRVSGPVLALTSFMRRVGAGHLDEPASFGGAAEFRRLSAALNRMIQDLREGTRMRASLAMATEVQQNLLPRTPPRLRRMDVAGHSTYCDETGGDYFDFICCDDDPNRVIVVCGDVMGHGVAAALLMAGVRGILRSQIATTNAAGNGARVQLGRLLFLLNDQMLTDTGGRRFMTLYLIELDAADHTARWACAGHDPAVVYDPDADTFTALDGGDLPLGVQAGSDYQEFTCRLRPGQVIFIGTDGVWEATDAAGEKFGKERLREAIRSAARSDAAADIEAAVTARLKAFVGNERPRDDVTFVVLKLTGVEAPKQAAKPAQVAPELSAR